MEQATMTQTNRMLCKQAVHELVCQQMDLSRNMEDAEVWHLIDDMVIAQARAYALTLRERQQIGKEIFDAIRKLDILQELIEAEDVTEIMVNGTEHIFIERDGRIQEWEKQFPNRKKLEDVIQQIVATCNRAVNEASPIVDARLENGSRVHVILPPVALNGPIVTIRSFPKEPITMEGLIQRNSISQEAAIFLNMLVKAGYNIFISGGTGSGKTTFLNALSHAIPKTERVITIEDSAELQLQELPNLVRLETRNETTEGTREITIRDLIKAALRMRPDRIIVGEVRGAEAIDMLQALNTGHEGSLSTGHANSAQDMLSRLETMVLMGMDLPLEAVRRQVASGIDIIVHLGRLRDKSRRVLQVAEVIGYERGEIQLNPLFEFAEFGEQQGCIEGELRACGQLTHKEKLVAAGIKVCNCETLI